MKLPYIHRMTVIRDTTETLTFSVKDLPSAITGVYFTVKKSFNQDTYTFQKTLNNGVSISGDKYIVKIAPTDTESLPTGLYVYGLKIVYGTDKKELLRGIFEILEESD